MPSHFIGSGVRASILPFTSISRSAQLGAPSVTTTTMVVPVSVGRLSASALSAACRPSESGVLPLSTGKYAVFQVVRNAGPGVNGICGGVLANGGTAQLQSRPEQPVVSGKNTVPTLTTSLSE